MEETLLVKNNTVSLRTIGPIAEGGPRINIMPGQAELVPVSMLKVYEGNVAFIHAIETKALEIVIGKPETQAALPVEVPKDEQGQDQDPDDLLNS